MLVNVFTEQDEIRATEFALSKGQPSKNEGQIKIHNFCLEIGMR